ASGRCSVDDDRLTVGSVVCWTEVVAPPGFDTAAGRCITLVAGDNAVAVTDRPLPVAVTGVKRDAGTGRPLAGAAYDLVRRDDGRTVATATSGPDGRLDWGAQPPGVEYCAVERAAPAGYARNTEPVCRAVGAGVPVALALVDRVGPPTAVSAPSPPAPTPTATVAVPARAIAAPAPAPAPAPAGELPRTGRSVTRALRLGLGLLVSGFGLLV